MRSWTSTLTRFSRRLILRIAKPTNGNVANAISVSCQLIQSRYASMNAMVSEFLISTVTASEAVAAICCASNVTFDRSTPADDAS